MNNTKLCECKECKQSVSKKAKVCPHCGVKDPGIKTSDTLKGFLMIVIVIGLVGYCSGNSDDMPQSDISQHDTSQSDERHELSMLRLCDNYFRERIAIYEGSKLHTVLGRHNTFKRKDDIKFVVEATVVNAFGAKQKKVIGCYVKQNHKSSEYYNYNDITLFEVYD